MPNLLSGQGLEPRAKPTETVLAVATLLWLGGCSGRATVANAPALTDGGFEASTADGGSDLHDASGADGSGLDATTASGMDASPLDADARADAALDATDDTTFSTDGGNAGEPDAGHGSGTDAAITTPEGGAACVVGRTCDPVCDQLMENGVHEYIEMNPDDGSPVPPANVADLFNGTTPAGNPPCVTEPQDGALFPNNWLRPRIAYTATNDEVYFRIQIHADRQANDLVVYTGSKTWTIPNDIWAALAASTWGEDMTVTVSSVAAGGGVPATASLVHFQIAPANAAGSITYLALVGDETGGFGWLEGFHVGDEGVSQILTVNQVEERMSRDVAGNLQTNFVGPPLTGTLTNGPGSVQCIGCHAPTPDGVSVAFHDFYPWPGVVASMATVDAGAGAIPPWFTPGGQEAFALPWVGMTTFSPSVWQTGRHWAIAGLQVSATQIPWQGGGKTASPSSLAWFDLSTTQPLVFANPDGGPAANLEGENAMFVTDNLNKSYGYLARTGDPGPSASCPTWSHDGQSVAYVSNNAAQDGYLVVGSADLYTVPFNDGAGGTASPVTGASDSTVNEYYPSYSPDDRFIAFNRASPVNAMFYNADAEVFVVPSAGGAITRLAANDPPVCQGVTSPGITNSWPRWSPAASVCNGSTYYWLVFSSTRGQVDFDTHNMKIGTVEPTSHLYVTALVQSGSGALTSYPGIYVRNQPTQSSNFPGSGGQASPQSAQMPSWDWLAIAAP